MGVAFGECEQEELPSLRKFFQRVYRPDYVLAADENLLRWQFGRKARENEDTTRWCLKLARKDGEIVGCVGYIPVEVSLASGVYRGAWTANWVVDAEHRRLGLGPLLMRQLTGEFDVTLVVGVSRDAQEALPRLGWTDFGELDRYVRVLDPEGAAVLTPTGEAPLAAEEGGPSEGSSAVERTGRIPEDATSLWDELFASAGNAGTRRSAAYLKWRYEDHPSGGYRIFAARGDGNLRGLAVYRVERVRDLPARVGRIVEVIAYDDAALDLILAVVDDARGQGVAVMDFFCSSQRLAPVMRRAGFVPGEDAAVAGIPRLFQPIDRRRGGIRFMAYLANLPAAVETEHWFVTSGDGDQDRPN
jgi:GNAT superfamily N-acetyltransferase